MGLARRPPRSLRSPSKKNNVHCRQLTLEERSDYLEVLVLLRRLVVSQPFERIDGRSFVVLTVPDVADLAELVPGAVPDVPARSRRGEVLVHRRRSSR
jgi:hypothetical protein